LPCSSISRVFKIVATTLNGLSSSLKNSKVTYKKTMIRIKYKKTKSIFQSCEFARPKNGLLENSNNLKIFIFCKIKMDFFSGIRKRSPVFSCASWQDQKMDSLKIIVIIIYFRNFNFNLFILSRSPCFGFARQWLYFSSSESSFFSSPCHHLPTHHLCFIFASSIYFYYFSKNKLGLAREKWNKDE
jgi:hypothetical protein